MQNLKQETFAKVQDLSGNGASDQQETCSASTLYQRARQLGSSAVSLGSNRSDVSEKLEKIEKHVSETLQKTEDKPPDMNALLCALYSLVMDNTKTLQAVSEKVGASDICADDNAKEMKTLNEQKRDIDDQFEMMEEERVEKYV